MKENFEKAEIEMISIEANDIITESPPNELPEDG